MIFKRLVFILSVMLILIFQCAKAQQQEPQNLKDSLLQYYTMEELRDMSSEERWNIIRQLRGLAPIDYNKVKTHDKNGVLITQNIPKEKASSVILERVKEIDSKKDGYTKAVFPNSYADILQEYDGGFFVSFLDREPEETYKAPLEEFKDEDVSVFSNFSRRSYYFNSEGELRLITLEVGYNINEGEKFGWADHLPYRYKKECYYIWNDSLQMYCGMSGIQHIGGEPSSITQQMLDTTKVSAEESFVYYYRNNGYKVRIRKGAYNKEYRKERLQALPFDERDEGSSNGVIWLCNYRQEYEEYTRKANDYLHPVPTSFFEPYGERK